MAIDWTKVGAKVQELQERAESGSRGPSIIWWKPSAGESTVRVLGPWTTEEPHANIFFREVSQHWIDNKPIVCRVKTPHLEGTDCAACDLVKALRADKLDVRAQGLVKEYRGKSAYLMSIIDREDPEYTAEDVASAKANGDEELPEVGDLKVKVYAANYTVFNDIINQLQANKEEDFTDAEKGSDLVIKKTGKGQFGTNYAATFLRKTSPVGGTFKLIDLTQVGFTMDNDEIIQLLAKGPAGDFLASAGLGSGQPAATATLPSSTAGESTSAGDDLRAAMKAAAAEA